MKINLTLTYIYSAICLSKIYELLQKVDHRWTPIIRAIMLCVTSSKWIKHSCGNLWEKQKWKMKKKKNWYHIKLLLLCIYCLFSSSTNSFKNTWGDAWSGGGWVCGALFCREKKDFFHITCQLWHLYRAQQWWSLVPLLPKLFFLFNFSIRFGKRSSIKTSEQSQTSLRQITTI